jgi:hypothetical protein
MDNVKALEKMIQQVDSKVEQIADLQEIKLRPTKISMDPRLMAAIDRIEEENPDHPV